MTCGQTSNDLNLVPRVLSRGRKRKDPGNEVETTCSLGGTASLGLHLPYFRLTIQYCRLPENDCAFDRLLTLLRESGRHPKSSVKAVAIFLFLVIKSAFITVPCNENVPRVFLMSGDIDINPNPGPVSASTAGKINCLVMNARSLKSYHKDSTINWQSVRNLHVSGFLVFVNET